MSFWNYLTFDNSEFMKPCNRFYNTGPHAHMYYLLGHGQSAYPWLGMHRLWPLKALGLPEEIVVVLACPYGDRRHRRNHWFQHRPLFDEQKEPQPFCQSSPGEKINIFQKYVLTWSRISANVWIWPFIKPHKVWLRFFLSPKKCFLNDPFFEKLKIKFF